MSGEMMFSVSEGLQKGQRFSFPAGDVIVFGRSRRADVQLVEPDVSAVHFQVRMADGEAELRCISRYGLKVSGRSLPQDGVCRLNNGDSISAGANAVVCYEGTSFPVSDETRSVDETVATSCVHAEDAETLISAEESGHDKYPAESVDVSGSEDGVTMFPTDDETDAATSFEGQDDRTGAGSFSDGETCEMNTRLASMDIINAMKEDYERKGKIRKAVLLCGIGVFFLSLIGIYFLTQKSRETEWMSIPKPVKAYLVSSSEGKTLLRVDYPYSESAVVVEGPNGSGVKVTSAMGRDRDVPYMLLFDVRKDPVELRLSTSASVWRWMQDVRNREKGIAFEAQSESEIVPKFFEDDYPWCCQMQTQYGVKYVTQMYQNTHQDGVIWRGLVLYFRSGDTSYVLRREIPETYWKRGVGQLSADPNIGVFAHYSETYWESPGAVGLPLEWSNAELFKAIGESLNADRSGIWGKVALWIDALLIKSWSSDVDMRYQALDRLAQLRKYQEDFYNGKQNAFEVAKMDDRGKKMLEIRQDVKSVFDKPTDRRYFMLGDGRIW